MKFFPKSLSVVLAASFILSDLTTTAAAVTYPRTPSLTAETLFQTQAVMAALLNWRHSFKPSGTISEFQSAARERHVNGVGPQEREIADRNVRLIFSNAFYHVLQRESFGGNAGEAHLTVNGAIDTTGRIIEFANLQSLSTSVRNRVLKGELFRFSIDVKVFGNAEGPVFGHDVSATVPAEALRVLEETIRLANEKQSGRALISDNGTSERKGPASGSWTSRRGKLLSAFLLPPLLIGLTTASKSANVWVIIGIFAYFPTLWLAYQLWQLPGLRRHNLKPHGRVTADFRGITSPEDLTPGNLLKIFAPQNYYREKTMREIRLGSTPVEHAANARTFRHHSWQLALYRLWDRIAYTRYKAGYVYDLRLNEVLTLEEALAVVWGAADSDGGVRVEVRESGIHVHPLETLVRGASQKTWRRWIPEAANQDTGLKFLRLLMQQQEDEFKASGRTIPEGRIWTVYMAGREPFGWSLQLRFDYDTEHREDPPDAPRSAPIGQRVYGVSSTRGKPSPAPRSNPRRLDSNFPAPFRIAAASLGILVVMGSGALHQLLNAQTIPAEPTMITAGERIPSTQDGVVDRLAEQLMHRLRSAGFLNEPVPHYDLRDKTVRDVYRRLLSSVRAQTISRDLTSWEEIRTAVDAHFKAHPDGRTLIVARGAGMHIWGALPDLEQRHQIRYVSASSLRLNMQDLARDILVRYAPPSERDSMSKVILTGQLEREIGVVKTLGYESTESFIRARHRFRGAKHLMIGMEETGLHEFYAGSPSTAAAYQLLRIYLDEFKPTNILVIGEDLWVGAAMEDFLKGDLRSDDAPLLLEARRRGIPVAFGAFGWLDRKFKSSPQIKGNFHSTLGVGLAALALLPHVPRPILFAALAFAIVSPFLIALRAYRRGSRSLPASAFTLLSLPKKRGTEYSVTADFRGITSPDQLTDETLLEIFALQTYGRQRSPKAHRSFRSQSWPLLLYRALESLVPSRKDELAKVAMGTNQVLSMEEALGFVSFAAGRDGGVRVRVEEESKQDYALETLMLGGLKKTWRQWIPEAANYDTGREFLRILMRKREEAFIASGRRIPDGRIWRIDAERRKPFGWRVLLRFDNESQLEEPRPPFRPFGFRRVYGRPETRDRGGPHLDISPSIRRLQGAA